MHRWNYKTELTPKLLTNRRSDDAALRRRFRLHLRALSVVLLLRSAHCERIGISEILKGPLVEGKKDELDSLSRER